MKTPWREAKPEIIKRIQDARLRAMPLPSADGRPIPSAANAWLQANEVAVRCGYVYDAPTTPLLDELAKLEHAGDPTVGRFRQLNSIELGEERKARLRWNAQESWRAGPSNEELTAAEAVVREQEREAAAVEARAKQIVEEADLERIQKSVNAARAKARKEIDALKGTPQ